MFLSTPSVKSCCRDKCVYMRRLYKGICSRSHLTTSWERGSVSGQRSPNQAQAAHVIHQHSLMQSLCQTWPHTEKQTCAQKGGHGARRGHCHTLWTKPQVTDCWTVLLRVQGRYTGQNIYSSHVTQVQVKSRPLFSHFLKCLLSLLKNVVKISLKILLTLKPALDTIYFSFTNINSLKAAQSSN